MLRVAYTPDVSAAGAIDGWIASIVDMTERRRAEAQRDLLIDEVNHRVRNILATVIAIARYSFDEDKPFGESLRVFITRLQALSQTHRRLAEVNWSTLTLKVIVEDETAPYRMNGNFRVSGPVINLDPRSAQSWGMAVHELAANAAKYGALSTPDGKVEVVWSLDDALNRLRFEWIERGGPPVNLPKRSGFGRMLLEKALAAELNADVALEFPNEGIACIIVAPVAVRSGH